MSTHNICFHEQNMFSTRNKKNKSIFQLKTNKQTKKNKKKTRFMWSHKDADQIASMCRIEFA